MTSQTHACRDFEVELSALMDGALQGDDLLDTCDHLAKCEACRGFYLNARLLDKRLVEMGAPHTEQMMPGRLWNRISRGSGLRRGISWISGQTLLWGSLAAAALILLGMGLWFFRALDDDVPDAELGRVLQVNMNASLSPMNDHRFLLMVKELLEADKKYQTKMVEIIQELATNDLEYHNAEGALRNEDGGEGDVDQLSESVGGARI